MMNEKDKAELRARLQTGVAELQRMLADYIRETADVVHDVVGAPRFHNADFRDGMYAAAALLDPDGNHPFTGRPNSEHVARRE